MRFRVMTTVAEAAFLMDDADVSAWWSASADVTGRVVAAIAVACATVPAMNARYDAALQSFTPLPTIDLGIAIETNDGVRVPVLTDVGHTPATEIRRRLNALRVMIEEGARRPGVTLVNFGRGPCRYAILPLEPPQVAIVATGQVSLQPVPHKSRVTYRHVLPLTLSYDTRACNLGEAVRFLGAIKSDLALPELPLSRGAHG